MGISPTVAADRAIAPMKGYKQPLASMTEEQFALAQSDSIQVRMARLGMGTDVILKRIRAKFDAKETKFFANKGEIVSTRNVIAHDIQLRALEMAARIAGLDQAGRTNINIGANAVGIMVSDGTAPSAWIPQLPSSVPNSTPATSVRNDTNADSTTVTSTIEGTGKRTGGLGHDRRNRRHTAASVPNSKVGKALRKSNGRHGAGANIPNGNNGRTKKLAVPKRKRDLHDEFQQVAEAVNAMKSPKSKRSSKRP